ncbi:MAG: AraC family transcriptional regulator [Nitrospirota bacterium]
MAQSNIFQTDITTKKCRPVYPGAPVLTSRKAPWDGIILERHRLPAQELPEGVCQTYMIVCQLSSPALLEYKENGRFKRGITAPGSLGIHPLNASRKVRLTEDADLLVLSLAPHIMARAAHELTYEDRIQIVQRVGIFDEQIRQIVMAFKTEVETGGHAGRLYGESLAYALAALLLSKYSADGKLPETMKGALPQRKLERAIEFIHDNLEKDITLTEVAQELGMSPYYFARSFKHTTGRTPHRYLIEQRIERAKTLLRETDLPLAVIAYSVGFQSQSHFTDTFRKFTSITPLKYRKSC